jgi:hypothetical protein
VALHLVAISALATPDLSSALDRKAWKAPTVQDEIGVWAKRLSVLGADLTPAELEDQAWMIATSWANTRESMLRPFRPYASLVGARQRWRMFAAPNRVPARLRVAVELDGEWRTVYEAGSEAHAWQAGRLDTERVRVVVQRASWAHRRADYKRLANWIADEAARDFPDATRVRLSFIRARTLTAKQVRAGQLPDAKEERKLVRELEGRR